MILAAHFLKQYSHVTKADIYIEEKPWNRIQMVGLSIKSMDLLWTSLYAGFIL